MLSIKSKKRNLRSVKAKKAKPKDASAQIDRINELSKMARGTWFSLLGYLAFVGVTLLAVQDADFFVSTRKTQLPIVNIPIPTASFFIFGPILGTALFVYLHLYLIRLWDALSEAPAKIGDTPLSEKVLPWLINDFGLAFRKDEAFKGRPMDWVSHTVTFLLVFAAAPFIMGAFWVRHWPSHAALLNGFLAILFAITLITTFASYHTAYYRLRKGVKYADKPNHMLALLPFIGICIVTLGITAIKVEGIITEQKASDDPPQSAIYSYNETPLPTGLNFLWEMKHSGFKLWSEYRYPFAPARANLEENDLVGRPANWLDYDTQKHAFRKTFCKGESLSNAVCGPVPEAWQKPPIIQKAARLKWAENFDLTIEDQATYFASLETRFQSAWQAEFKARTAALPKLNLQARDLRNADAYRVFLSGADMRKVNLQGAIFSYADLQGADLRRAKLRRAALNAAKLQGASLNGAEMQGANFDGAELQGADLRDTQLQGARLVGAQLQGADLRRAQLRGAALGNANLQRARLVGAQLQGAVFFYADLQGVDLSFANLNSVKWAGATLHSSAHSTDFRGSIGLTQEMLENVIGDEETLLFASEGHSLHVWSCWLPDNLPPNLDQTLERLAGIEIKEYLFARWVCSDTNPRVPTGTTKPLDAE